MSAIARSLVAGRWSRGLSAGVLAGVTLSAAAGAAMGQPDLETLREQEVAQMGCDAHPRRMLG
jgi:uncharacterized protein (DUF2237 family)